MLDKDDIIELLYQLNDKLKAKGIIGDIALYGGTVMTLVLDARECTKDIDAIFVPTEF